MLEDPSSSDLAQSLNCSVQLADLDGYEDYHRFIELRAPFHTGLSGTHVRELFNTLRMNDTFTSQVKSRLTEDLPASDIQRKEKEHFSHSWPSAEDSARKLSDKTVKREQILLQIVVYGAVFELVK